MDENGLVSSCAGLLEKREVLQSRTGRCVLREEGKNWAGELT